MGSVLKQNVNEAELSEVDVRIGRFLIWRKGGIGPQTPIPESVEIFKKEDNGQISKVSPDLTLPDIPPAIQTLKEKEATSNGERLDLDILQLVAEKAIRGQKALTRQKRSEQREKA